MEPDFPGHISLDHHSSIGYWAPRGYAFLIDFEKRIVVEKKILFCTK